MISTLFWLPRMAQEDGRDIEAYPSTISPCCTTTSGLTHKDLPWDYALLDQITGTLGETRSTTASSSVDESVALTAAPTTLRQSPKPLAHWFRRSDLTLCKLR